MEIMKNLEKFLKDESGMRLESPVRTYCEVPTKAILKEYKDNSHEYWRIGLFTLIASAALM